MAFVPVPQVAKFAILGRNQGKDCHYVFDVRKSTAIPGNFTDADIDATLITIRDWVIASLAPQTSAAVNFGSVQGTAQHAANLPSREILFAQAGALSGSALPNNCALAVTKRTAVSSRNFRGRFYHFGIVEADTDASDGNAVSSVRADAIEAAYDQLRQDLEDQLTVLVNLCVASRFFNNAPRASGVFEDVTSVVVRNRRIDTIRRRMPEPV